MLVPVTTGCIVVTGACTFVSVVAGIAYEVIIGAEATMGAMGIKGGKGASKGSATGSTTGSATGTGRGVAGFVFFLGGFLVVIKAATPPHKASRQQHIMSRRIHSQIGI